MDFNNRVNVKNISIKGITKNNIINVKEDNVYTDNTYEEIDYSESNQMSALDVVKEAKSSNNLYEYKEMLELRKQQLEEQLSNLEYVYNNENDSVFVNNYYYSTLSEAEKNELQDIGPFPQNFNNYAESNKDISTRIKELKDDYNIICSLLHTLDYNIQLQPYEALKDDEKYLNYINKYNSKISNIDYDKLKDMGYDISNYQYEVRNNGELRNDIDRLAILEYLLENTDKGIDDIVLPLLTDMSAYDKNINDLVICYKYMTEEERLMYHYLFETKGEDSANDYLLILQDKINQAYGVDLANEFLNNLDVDDEGKIKENLANLFGTSVQGLGDGLSNFYSGLENALMNNEQLTVDEYKKMIILQTLNEEANYLDEVYQFNTSLGNMVPAMATSAIVSFLGSPVAGTKVGTLLMGTSAYGNAKHQALAGGNNTLSSTIYGLLIGTSEATLGYFLGKVPGLSQTSGFTLKNLLCEGVEEYSQTWIDAGLQSVVLGNYVSWSEVPEDAKDSFIMGVLMSGLLNGGQSVVNIIINGVNCEINVEATLEYLEKHPNVSMEEALEEANPLVREQKIFTYDPDLYKIVDNYVSQHGFETGLKLLIREAYYMKDYNVSKSIGKNIFLYIQQTKNMDYKQAYGIFRNISKSVLSELEFETEYDSVSQIWFYRPKNFNQDIESANVNVVKEQLRSLPKDLVSATEAIYFYDTYNYGDFYFESFYGTPNFESCATGGNGVINYWAYTKAEFGVVVHELAHNYDRKCASKWDINNGSISSSEMWLQAMGNDENISGLTGVTNYAIRSKSPAEDFAESVKLYYTDYEALNQFPNRKALLDKYLEKKNISYTSVGDNFKTVLEGLAKKYGEENGIQMMKNYLETGNSAYITREGGLRGIIEQHTVEEYIKYLNSSN